MRKLGLLIGSLALVAAGCQPWAPSAASTSPTTVAAAPSPFINAQCRADLHGTSNAFDTGDEVLHRYDVWLGFEVRDGSPEAELERVLAAFRTEAWTLNPSLACQDADVAATPEVVAGNP